MIGNILHTNTHEHKYILKNENKREREKRMSKQHSYTSFQYDTQKQCMNNKIANDKNAAASVVC